MSSSETPEETAGQYSTDDDDQLSQEDTLIDRGVDDLLDEGYSPPDKWREPRDNETLDELLSEEEPDPAMQLDDDESDSEFPDCRQNPLLHIPAPERVFRLEPEIGWTAAARRIVAGAASESPRERPLPALTRAAIAPTVSSIGVSGSTRCG